MLPPLARSIAVATCLATFGFTAEAFGSNCAGTSTGLIPLTDLGTGLYQNVQGGLYAGGSNVRPPAHEAAGLAIANAIVPLDTLCQPPPHGPLGGGTDRAPARARARRARDRECDRATRHARPAVAQRPRRRDLDRNEQLHA